MSLGNRIGRGLRKTGDELGKFGHGFSKELGIKHSGTGASLGESAGQISAMAIAAPFRFAKDIINGAKGIDDTPEPAKPAESDTRERANIVDHQFGKAAV